MPAKEKKIAKKCPVNLVSIRRIRSYSYWFIPKEDLSEILRPFREIILGGVTLNPKAPVMKDVICGTGRISEADATGTIERRLPSANSVVREFILKYNPEAKHFFDEKHPDVPVEEVDFLFMDSNGNATAYMVARK